MPDFTRTALSALEYRLAALDPIAIKPWERQPDEDPQLWLMFSFYRDLGPTRTMRQAVRDYPTLQGGRRGDKGVTRLIRALKRDTAIIGRDWPKRARAWDDYQDQLRQEEITRLRLQTAAGHLNLIAKAKDVLAARLLGLDPADLDPNAVIKWLNALVRLERLVLGESTDNQSIRIGAVGGGQGGIDAVPVDFDKEIELYVQAVDTMMTRMQLAGGPSGSTEVIDVSPAGSELQAEA